MLLPAVVENVSKKPVNHNQKYLILEVLATDSESDEDVELPYLRFKLF